MTNDDAHYAVQQILFAMHIYRGYKIDSRGPSGCLMDVIRRLDPETYQKMVDGAEPGELMEREDDEPNFHPEAPHEHVRSTSTPTVCRICAAFMGEPDGGT